VNASLVVERLFFRTVRSFYYDTVFLLSKAISRFRMGEYVIVLFT